MVLGQDRSSSAVNLWTFRPRSAPTVPKGLAASHHASTRGAAAAPKTTTAGSTTRRAKPFLMSYRTWPVLAPFWRASPTVFADL